MKPSTASVSRMSRDSNSAFPPPLGHLAHHSLERLGAAPAADHCRAEPGQLERGGPAQAGPGAGDDADLPVEQSRERRSARSSPPPSRVSILGADGGITLRVAMKATAIPVEEPLAGGVEGASLVIEPLKVGEARWPPSFFDARGRGLISRLGRSRFAQPGEVGGEAGARLPRPAPGRRGDPDRHGPPPLGRPECTRQSRPIWGPPLPGRGGRTS